MTRSMLTLALAAIGAAPVFSQQSTKAERLVAIENVCAWPNLQILPNGDILAFIFNQPAHGAWEGGIDCWASVDGGRTWKLRGVVAPHKPGTNRMNIAAGIAKNGELVVLVSGYPERPPPPGTKPAASSSKKSAVLPLPLPNWICRSSDQGRTWSHTENFPLPEGVPYVIPFGDIIRTGDGTLTAAFYGSSKLDPEVAKGTKRFKAEQMFLATSRDNGKTWADVREIKLKKAQAGKDKPIFHEPALLALDDRRWLAAVRGSLGQGASAVQLYASDDAGATWFHREQLSEALQYPSHLLRLSDGRILLTYGSRTAKHYGVGYRLSKDEGQTWSKPGILVHVNNAKDGGYPASVQLKDGTVVTAYYMGTPSTKDQPRRYHMGVVRWHSEKDRP
jgi:hypothetical protein